MSTKSKPKGKIRDIEMLMWLAYPIIFLPAMLIGMIGDFWYYGIKDGLTWFAKDMWESPKSFRKWAAWWGDA